jgi:hypothetical protein
LFLLRFRALIHATAVAASAVAKMSKVASGNTAHPKGDDRYRRTVDQARESTNENANNGNGVTATANVEATTNPGTTRAARAKPMRAIPGTPRIPRTRIRRKPARKIRVSFAVTNRASPVTRGVGDTTIPLAETRRYPGEGIKRFDHRSKVSGRKRFSVRAKLSTSAAAVKR